MKNIKTKILNGEEVEYQDVIHHKTTTEFSFWDRIKILFGAKLVIKSELFTGHEFCIIHGSDATSYVEPLIRKRNSEGLSITIGEGHECK